MRSARTSHTLGLAQRLVYGALLVPLLAGLLAGCAGNAGAPAGLQQTADALAITVAAHATAEAVPPVNIAPTETRPAAQSSGPISATEPPNPGALATLSAAQGSAPDPAMATALAATLAAGGSLDPAMATQLAASGAQPPAAPGGQDPLMATQIAYATQMALQGKPLDPALITQAAQTQAAGGGPNPATAAALEAAFGPIKAELPNYGVDPNRGRPGWVHPPVTLETQGNDQYVYANDYGQLIAKDFVVSADITWNTKYGDSGCGFVIRSDGNRQSANQYVVVITRGSNGHMIFSVMVNGEVVNAHDVYANGLDGQFEWQNDTTNRLTVVGRGNIISVYTNGTRLGDMDPRKPPPEPELPTPPQKPNSNNPQVIAAYQRAKAEYDATVARIQAQYRARLKLFRENNVLYDQGFIAMVAATDAGYTRCQFNDAWLWLIED